MNGCVSDALNPRAMDKRHELMGGNIQLFSRLNS
jgi:hypothetical protein